MAFFGKQPNIKKRATRLDKFSFNFNMLNGKIKYKAKVIRGRSYFKYIKPLTQCCPIPYRIQINNVEVFYRPVVKLGGYGNA